MAIEFIGMIGVRPEGADGAAGACSSGRHGTPSTRPSPTGEGRGEPVRGCSPVT